MYLRTTRRRNAEKRCAVAKVVYSFGRADELDRAALQRLAKSILRVFPGEEAIAAESGVRIRNAWPYGVTHAIDAIWRELGIDKAIGDLTRRHGTRQPFERALFAMVANRTHEPYSKLYCREQWLGEEVFFPGEEALELEHLYRAMDFLEAHKAQVEKEIFFRTADLMKADVDLIFYDTTSLHFEVDEEDRVWCQISGGADRRASKPRASSPRSAALSPTRLPRARTVLRASG